MIESQKLKKKIHTLKDLKDIVSSMKAYANFTILKSKRELPNIREYQNSVEDSIAYMIEYFPYLKSSKLYQGKTLYILFGAQEGLCGAFNEKILEYFENIDKKDYYLISVGRKINDEIGEKKLNVIYLMDGASNIDTIEEKVSNLVEYLVDFFEKNSIKELILIYSKLLDNSDIVIKNEKILPPDFEKFQKYIKIKEPLLYLEKENILDSLIEEYLLISLYRAFIESISSENQSRLNTMINAENHIEKKTKDINEKLNILRQEEITNELLEIINGYKSIKRKK
ncbi:F0F1 ATP synthase subunit gamma [Nitrosophilus kaiyonis]|uniref:F0F1 ATP synthase subunit gamma n=1 Tax=Nitrosophilus kaiyonis TaxID=2930200 RepID=UPI002491D9BB|nr:F0F1 ATP synthase subunit gamma [Nitrosophilus kaiyonis]